MCDPITATVAAVSTVGAVAANKYVSGKQKKAERAANEAASQAAAENQRVANENNERITGLESELEAERNKKKSSSKTIIQKQAPQVQDPDVAAARNRDRRSRIKQSSANSTLVTGGSGIAKPAATGAKRLFGE